jgi:NitT/TauT family transport system ATP-binding protein
MYNNNVIFTNTNAPDVIELKGVSQKYNGSSNYVIQDLNMLIEDTSENGKFIVILGVSGCGKSTLLRYISGLQKPTSGEVLINGKPIEKDIKVGMVFQQYSSFPWLSVLDNVALGLQFKGVSKKERHEKAMEMIKLVGLEGHEGKFAKYPTLSGGQLQRVAIARSLVSAPEILLMDEPFGALDVNTRLKMQDLLCEIWSKIRTTIIFVTHDISEAVYLGDEIFFMRANPGKIVRKMTVDLPYGRSAELKRTPKFQSIVYEVEDVLIGIQNHIDEEKKNGINKPEEKPTEVINEQPSSTSTADHGSEAAPGPGNDLFRTH